MNEPKGTSTDLVGPLPVILFRGGPEAKSAWRKGRQALPSVAYAPPKNTLDPRYDQCTEHRVACDCREAEFAEELNEHRMERQQMKAAFDEMLAGHETWRRSEDSPGCMCTGCQIARACHVWPTTACGEPS
jgi:hypothetical protein